MQKAKLRLLSILIISSIVLGSFIGCGGQKSDKSDAAKTSQTAATQQSKPIELSYFIAMDGKVAASLKSYSELALYKKMEEKFNVKFKFLHPPVGQEKEQFNLMLASGELPDIIYWDWKAVAGGPGKILQEGSIIKLNDLINQNAPNLKAVFEKNVQAKKQSMLDDGTFYMFPFFRLESPLRVNQGLMMRKDWLQKVGMNPPVTIDDWYNVLKAFKEKDPNGNGQPDELPLVSEKLNTLNNFAVAWGIRRGFYTKDGKIGYGPAEPVYKEYLTTMNKWYKEKLIDADFPATDTKSFDAKVTGDLAGAFWGWMNGNLGKYSTLMAQKDPKFDLTAVPWPVSPNGKSYTDNIEINSIATGAGTAITKSNKYKVETVKLLDYAYGQEGNLLNNFGVEGESYKMENGYPKYTDLILKNPKGLAAANALALYNHVGAGPLIQDQRYCEQFRASVRQQLEGEKIWDKASPDLVPPPITPTEAESTRMASVMNQINTYVDEMTNKFIMGTEPISKFDDYIKALKGMGIGEAVKIQQAALDRYNKR